LGWSGDELTALAANRSISADQVLADELTRATVQLAGSNALTTFFWQIDPSGQPAAFTALGNLNSVLSGAKFESQAQGRVAPFLSTVSARAANGSSLPGTPRMAIRRYR